jgi:hypothetical protein
MAKSTQADFAADACSGASMAEVKGIGGAFVLSEDPDGLFSAVNDADGNRIELYEERFPDTP